MFRHAAVIIALLLVSQAAHSQYFFFGRNKVQYTEFDWHVLRTEHFDIYYYREMHDLAEWGAALAEEGYAELTTKFNHNVANRIPLVFYSTHLHFQQTNITPGFIPEGVGGFFEFLKGRVVIPYNGSLWDFRHVIRHELVHVFMHSKINRQYTDHRLIGGGLPPLWFVEGLAEYWSIEWDVQADMILRDAVISDYLIPVSRFGAIQGTYLMYKEGQAVLEFIGERYGEEKVLLLMENFWKSASFEEVFEMTLGKDFEAFDEEWTYALKKKYYPFLGTSDTPSRVSIPLVREGFNSKPVFHRRRAVIEGTEAAAVTPRTDGEVYFIGNHSGYTSIWRVPYGVPDADPELIIEGEKTGEFEAFHPFQSKIDVSAGDLLAFVTKSGENDALHVYDLAEEDLRSTYHFTDLVVLGSPSWDPAGKRIVFNAVDKGGTNDLYVWDTDTEVLTRLTNDSYDDRDASWSPDGGVIAFSSDRSNYGRDGKYNLFTYELSTGTIRYLTYGDETYSAPAWSPDGSKLLFTSDRGGVRNIWMAEMSSPTAAERIRKVTGLVTGSFDPSWADTGIVFVAFEGFNFEIRAIGDAVAAADSAREEIPAAFDVAGLPWKPPSLSGADESAPLEYEPEYSLDVAQSQISTDPVFGTVGAAYLGLSDLLGNNQYYFLLSNSAQSTDELLNSFNVAIARVSLEQRANYAYGIYRFSGRRYDLADPDEYFYEKVFGGYLTLSYPLSKFERIAVNTSLSSSEKDPIAGYFIEPSSVNLDFSRRALFLSNSLAFTHDNSLWGPSGPLDGNRYNLTVAYTSDIRTSNANYYSVIADYRHYFRIAQRSAYAVRLWLFYNDGKESRRFFMGGSWDLRGFPRYSLRGKKLWLMSHELRFPFMDRFVLGFPFGAFAFSGFRGALFFDVGSAWDDVYEETYGSFGGGLRLNLAGAIVLRYDIGKRIEDNFRGTQSGLFQQFFFGWDF